MYVIEGTWEEVKRHEAELRGRHLRVTVTAEKRAQRKHSPPAATSPKKLVGYGAFKGLFGGVEGFLAAKQEEVELEDRKFESRP